MNTAKDISEISPAKELLSRKESGAGPLPPRALDHLAFALIAAATQDMAECLAALAGIRREFVDWNEVRVARTQEIARSLGKIADAENIALRIREEYNAFFEKKGALNFDFLAAGKPAESRRHLNQVLPRLSKSAISLLLYEFCPGSSLPLSDDALKQARRDGLVGKSADRNQIARALADGLEPSEAALLIQHWEIEATGSPYGESRKNSSTQKKEKKAAAPGKQKKAAAGRQK